MKIAIGKRIDRGKVVVVLGLVYRNIVSFEMLWLHRLIVGPFFHLFSFFPSWSRYKFIAKSCQKKKCYEAIL